MFLSYWKTRLQEASKVRLFNICYFAGIYCLQRRLNKEDIKWTAALLSWHTTAIGCSYGLQHLLRRWHTHTLTNNLKHTNEPGTSIVKKGTLIYSFDNIVFFMCRLDYWFLGCVSLQGWVPARQKSTSSPALRRAALSRLGLCYSHLTSTVVFLLCYLKMRFGDQKYFFQTFKEEFSPASENNFQKRCLEIYKVVFEGPPYT